MAQPARVMRPDISCPQTTRTMREYSCPGIVLDTLGGLKLHYRRTSARRRRELLEMRKQLVKIMSMKEGQNPYAKLRPVR